jgi:hypothetical protein
MHQPNLQRPEEMLGICHACGQWHYVESSENDPSLMVALLPIRHLARDAFRPPPAGVTARLGAGVARLSAGG